MSLEKDIINVVKNVTKEKTTSYDVSAEVVRVEDGTVWVHIPGGVDETPIEKTINAKAGDIVKVRISGGRAWATGNSTAPPTDDAVAKVADEKAVNATNIATEAGENALAALLASESAQNSARQAEQAAGEAQSSAESASQAASDAWDKASDAETAASTAQSRANDAYTAAGNAQTSASNAQTSANNAQASANNANEYASRALGNLTTIQSVAETLTWITQHGTMALTSDTSIDPTHVYFVVDPNGDYIVGNTHYSVVIEPEPSALSTYYELTIDESLNNYVGTHLALTSEGLWLLPAASGTNKVLIATGAGTTYTNAGTYIVDSSGDILASFRANGATIGKVLSGMPRIEIASNGLRVVQNNNGSENIVASFTDGGAVIGYSNEAHFEIGTNKIGGKLGANNEYFAVGNKKDVSTTYTFIGDGATTAFAIYYPSEQPDVTIDGVATTAFTYTDTTLTFSTAPPNGSTVLITYATSLNSPYFTVGGRSGQIGAFSSTLGSGLTASGLYAVAEGLWSDATGFASHAEGFDTSANGSYSHSEGNTTVSSGIASHAEGYGTNATGSHAHAEGFGTTASNNSAHAEGYNTSATGGYSHSEGSNTTASGGFSHAEGSHTVASGGEAHAQNYYTIADRLYQTAIGKFNTAHNSNNAFVIGNGTADDARSDCFEVDFNGNVDASGNISSNGNISATGDISADGNISADGDITATNHVIGIVETGTTSNSWDYRLWSDGTYEAWRSHGFSGMALTSSSAGTYYGGGTTLGVPIFPNNSNTGVLQCICSENGAFSHSSGVYLYQVLHASATTATAEMTFQFRAHTSTSNAACGVDIYLRGTYT